MLLRCYFKLILIPFIFCPALHFEHLSWAQTNTTSARKIDEFGDILLTDLKARLDNFAIELTNNPGTRGFIVVYRSRRDLPGLNSRLIGVMKRYLYYTRGLSSERIVAVDGGEASCLAQELWVVPVGATPTPRSDAYSREFIDTESARKFDEYYYPPPNESSEDDAYEYIDARDSLEAFAGALRKEPRSLAYIIAYPQYYIERWYESVGRGGTRAHRRIHLDYPSTAWKMLKAVKADLVNTYHIAPLRVKVVNGGYRRMRQVELWIVPRGEHAPIPTPNAFPKVHRTG